MSAGLALPPPPCLLPPVVLMPVDAQRAGMSALKPYQEPGEVDKRGSESRRIRGDLNGDAGLGVSGHGSGPSLLAVAASRP